jgi:aromatic ring-opening dioxygenase LigB subunit
MTKIVFAAISPHPPIILPSVGSPEDRAQVRNTILALEKLGRELKEANPDSIIISAPHPDWGFNVPLFFLAKDFKGKIETHLIELEPPQFYFAEGKKVYRGMSSVDKKIALIASGDMSHVLEEGGPYGFHPDGPKFDMDLIESLKRKDIERIFKLDDLYPNAGECGLRSFCFVLGILEASGLNWQSEILSYEGPFGVGYLVANFKL